MGDRTHPCLTILVGEAEAEELPWVLQDLGANAVEERDQTTMTSEGSGKVLLVAGFESFEARDAALLALTDLGGNMEISARNVEDDGWSIGWRDFFQPVLFDTLQIITPWMDPACDTRKKIVVDPGQAFGTGGHATTRLLISMLERRALAGKLSLRLLDVGVGSGVLSIAAIKLGAKEALGVDIEEESVVATIENAEVNGVGGSIEAVRGTARDISGQWPLVLANIELSVFLEHAVDIAPLVESGGELLVSGLLDEQVERCVALWPDFDVEETTSQEGWSAVALRRSR